MIGQVQMQVFMQLYIYLFTIVQFELFLMEKKLYSGCPINALII